MPHSIFSNPSMHRLLFLMLLFAFLSPLSNAQSTKPPVRSVAKLTWPTEVQKVDIPVTDNTLQPAMWYAPEDSSPKPLLVGLHTWSSRYDSAGGDAIFADWCIKQGWAFIHPHFRGPNNSSLAMGSDRAVQDIVEAVEWAKKQTAIDNYRIYLIGGSGGGHMSLVMAGRYPEIWAGVSAWCGISDIAAWHEFHSKGSMPGKYALDIEKALGASPAASESAKKDAIHRSPITWLANAKSIPLDINHGIHDGRTGSVPFTHSLHAFNAVIGNEPDRLLDQDITSYYESQKLPNSWSQADTDPSYGTWKPLFRKISGQTRITIFEGGHELVHQAALNWLALQRKNQPAVWKVDSFIPLKETGGETAK